MYLLVDLAASEQAQKVARVLLEDGVDCGEGGVVIPEDVLESGLGAEDIEDGIL